MRDEVDWESWSPRERAVLCYIVQDGQVLLMEKQRGLGAGKVNAPGGRIEPGETEEEAAVRETEEEVLVTPLGLRRAGRLRFQFAEEDGSWGYSLEGIVFTAEGFRGEPGATEEADPFWVSLGEVPYGRMWADDALWMPRMFRGETFDGRFIFRGDEMLFHRIDFSRG